VVGLSFESKLNFALVIIVAWIILMSVAIFRVTNYGKKKMAELQHAIERALSNRNFHIDKQFSTSHGMLYLDYKENRGAFFGFLDPLKGYKTPISELKYFSLNQITECALVQDDTMVHHNAVASGMVGAALFGLGGALAGATAMSNTEHGGHISVRVLMNDNHMPSLTITILNMSIMKSDPVYLSAFDTAQKIYNEFEGIVRMNQRNNAQEPSQGTPAKAVDLHQNDIAANARILEQINHLAQMQKDGILTADEFSEKKKILLNRLV
jgi:hypothetical protein